MPITQHANGEPVVKRSSFATILLVVWSLKNSDSIVLFNTSKASSYLLYDDTYRCVCAGNCVIHSDT